MYSQIYNPSNIPPSQPLNERMVPNAAGGYAYQVSEWDQLDRFLILGSTGGNYYFGEFELSKQNVDAVIRCIQEDGVRVVNRIVEISVSGRAVKNDPAIFALALVAKTGNDVTRSAAASAIPLVCRTGTHLLRFVAEADGLQKGWGRSMKRGVASWFSAKTSEQLAYQAVKYASRDKWALKDLLRLSHPKVGDNDVYQWILRGTPSGVPLLRARDLLHTEGISPETAALIVSELDVPREAIPTALLNLPEIWTAMLPKMPLTAMVRNLGKMSSLGLLDSGSTGEGLVLAALRDRERLRRARVHPLSLLVAMAVYRQGRGVKGSLTWNVSDSVVAALSNAVTLAMEFAPPTGRRRLLAIDVSGSMHTNVAGTPLLTHQAAACMAVAASRVETGYEVIAFSSKDYLQGGKGWESLQVRDRRLDDVTATLRSLTGGTDLAIPIRAAATMKPFDAIEIYTDSETWAGQRHLETEFLDYQRKVNPNVKLAIVSLTANRVTVGDPGMPNVLQTVGFDASLPAVLAAFYGATADSSDDV